MTTRSLSARRAWIEIIRTGSEDWCLPVALRKESVDRNANHLGAGRRGSVALRKESVDRNVTNVFGKKLFRVALRKESVDRNKLL